MTMKEYNIIIAGSRNFNDYKILENVCDTFILPLIVKKLVRIVSGTARGADKFGEMYAASHNIPVLKYPADWDKYGKSAGYIRNGQMAEIAHFLIVFWDGNSFGTKNMIEEAKKRNIPTLIIYFKEQTMFK